MLYAGYVFIGLLIFYFGYGVGREEMRWRLSEKHYEKKYKPLQPPKTATHEIEYHDMHKNVYRARISPN